MDIENLSVIINRNNKNVLGDDFLYYLKEIAQISKKTFVILKNSVKEEITNSLRDLNIDFLFFDKDCSQYEFYKYAINKIGFEEIQKYDNLILSNDSFYGPIYSFEDMFEQMQNETCDYWGFLEKNITKFKFSFFKNKSEDISVTNSDFLVFKKNLLSSKEFKKWWNNSYNFKTQEDYEIKQEFYFKKQNFKVSAFMKFDNYKSVARNFNYSVSKLLENNQLPIIPKASLFSPYSVTVENCLTHQTNDIVDFIKNKTNYDFELIYKDIIKNNKMSELKENLHLNFVLPTDVVKQQFNQDKKVALIVYIYYADLVDYCFKYIQSMPDNSDIYIVSSKDETLNSCREKAASIDNYNFEFRLKENKGRDVSAYLVSCADVFQKYDYICCVHDKKSPYFDSLIAEDFAYQCFECNLSTKNYVANVINTFESNPKIGLLTSPNMYFYHYLEGYSMFGNRTNLHNLYNKLNLTVPFDETPIAPYGSMFWIRGDAIKPLFRHKWEYEDFPTEPLPTDGTVSHAIERIYPFVAQEAGYLSGWIMPDSFCSIYLENLKYAQTKDLSEKQTSLFKNIFSIKNVYIENKKFKRITLFYNHFYNGRILNR